jgi:hypothetical protein
VQAPAKPDIRFTARTKKPKTKPTATPVSTVPPEDAKDPGDDKLAPKPDLRRDKDTPESPSGTSAK